MNYKYYLFLFVLIVSKLCFSQNFAPVGASWYYDERFAFSNAIDYIHFQSVKDTIIAGKNCQKITKRHYINCNFRPFDEYVYTQNDTVFFYDSTFNSFQILYDFTASQGDYWKILLKNEFNNTDTLTVTVDSVSSILINGFNLKVLYVTYTYSNPNAPVQSISSTITERLGDINYMFNWFPKTFICDNNYSNGLRCYSDNILGQYSTNIADSCNYVYTSVNELNNQKKLSIYPNPATGYFSFDATTGNFPARITITNSLGEKVYENNHLKSYEKINISQLPTGVYFITVKPENAQQIIYAKLIKK